MMKNILFILAVLAACSTTTSAQISVGAGIFYGFEIEEVGIQARGIYTINDAWRGAADFVFYLDGVEDVTVWEFNTNAHYVFFNNEQILAYALAGLNIYRVSFDTDSILGDLSVTETGINIGGGAQFQITEQLGILGELKYVLSDADQLGIGIGVLANF